MTRNPKLSTTESSKPETLAPSRLGQKSRWHRPEARFSVEWLEDRILLSHGGGGSGPPLQVFVIAASPASADLTSGQGHGGGGSGQGGAPTQQTSAGGPSTSGNSGGPTAAPVAGQASSGTQGSGKPSSNGGGPTVLAPDAQGSSNGSPNGSGSAVIATPVAQSSSGGAPNGSAGGSGTGGPLGPTGPGYPLIPGLGPVLSGDSTAARAPIPVLLPGSDPALAVIPTASAPAVSLVALDPTPQAGTVLASIATPIPPTAPAVVIASTVEAAAIAGTPILPSSVPSPTGPAILATVDAVTAVVTAPSLDPSSVLNSLGASILSTNLVAPDTATPAVGLTVAVSPVSVLTAPPAIATPVAPTAATPIIGNSELSALLATASPAASSSASVVALAVNSTEDSPILPETIPPQTALNATPVIGTTSTQAPVSSFPSLFESSAGASSVVTNLPSFASVGVLASSLSAHADNEAAVTSTPASASAPVSVTTPQNSRVRSLRLPRPRAVLVTSVLDNSEVVSPRSSSSVDAVGAANEMPGELARSLPGGPARDPRLFPRNLSESPALDQTAATLQVPPLVCMPADAPVTPGPGIATTVPIDIGSASESLTVADSVTSNIPAMSSSDLARAWEAAGDWLADLAQIEAAEATEMAARLAPVVLAAGVFLSWGSIYHSTRRIARQRDDELTCLETC